MTNTAKLDIATRHNLDVIERRLGELGDLDIQAAVSWEAMLNLLEQHKGFTADTTNTFLAHLCDYIYVVECERNGTKPIL
jgi:hypothetical protein